jgi:hypothetical protein
MMDPSTIAANTRKATNKAKRNKSVPHVFSDSDLAELENGVPGAFKHIPLLGDFEPLGWTLLRSHFVDASGFGTDREPALTQSAFAKMVAAEPTHGWGIGEWGQFQVYINEYARTDQ